jgi:hypothetical protein
MGTVAEVQTIVIGKLWLKKSLKILDRRWCIILKGTTTNIIMYWTMSACFGIFTNEGFFSIWSGHIGLSKVRGLLHFLKSPSCRRLCVRVVDMATVALIFVAGNSLSLLGSKTDDLAIIVRYFGTPSQISNVITPETPHD